MHALHGSRIVEMTLLRTRTASRAHDAFAPAGVNSHLVVRISPENPSQFCPNFPRTSLNPVLTRSTAGCPP
eukprot:8095-Prorocentrum_minimum.AAC.1